MSISLVSGFCQACHIMITIERRGSVANLDNGIGAHLVQHRQHLAQLLGLYASTGSA